MSILQPLDTAALMKSGHVTATDRFGTRRVYKRRLYSSSDDSDSDDNNVHADAATSSAAEELDPFVSLPDILISEATLRYVGYRPEIATTLWASWTDDAGWKADGVARETDAPTNQMYTVSFGEFVWRYAESSGRPIQVESDATLDKWNECLHACGLDAEACEAITDEAYQDVRQTASCLYWAIDTIQMRYRGLVDIQSLSRQREQARQRDQSRQKQESNKGSKASQPTSRRSISGTQRLNPGIETTTALSPDVANSAPGYLTLWKGVDQARIQGKLLQQYIYLNIMLTLLGMFNANGEFVTANSLVTTCRGDFSRREAFYFAVDKKVAIVYAGYAKRRTSVESVVLVRVQIPNAEIKSLSETELRKVYWPSDTWKELIFNCRRGNTFVLPRSLNAFLEAKLIIGTISTHLDRHYERLRAPSDIKETDLLSVDGSHGIQYVFVADRGGASFLDEHGKFKVFPLTGDEELQIRHQQGASM